MSEKDYDNLKQQLAVQQAMTDLVEVLFHHGFTDIRVGNVMRLFGTSEDHCKEFMDQRFVINGETLDMVPVGKTDDPFTKHPVISNKIH